MGLVSGLEDGLAFQPECVRRAKVYGGSRHQTERGVMMLVAIPLLKILHPGLGVAEAVKAVGVGRMILEGFEARFGVRVVIRDVRAGQALLNTQFTEEPGQGFGRHTCPTAGAGRPAVVGVDGQLIRREVKMLETGGQELLGVVTTLLLRDEPADDEATPSANPTPNTGRSIDI